MNKFKLATLILTTTLTINLIAPTFAFATELSSSQTEIVTNESTETNTTESTETELPSSQTVIATNESTETNTTGSTETELPSSQTVIATNESNASDLVKALEKTTPSVARNARQTKELDLALQKVRTPEGKALMNKSMSIHHQIENEILEKGYSSVEEYNNQIGATIPVESSVYYNNNAYYETPLPETIANDEERAIPLVLWGKAIFASMWTKFSASIFGKGMIAGASGAMGVHIVNDTRELIIKGYEKISTHIKSFIVGDGKVTSGGKVRTAQFLLRQHGYGIAVDGIWGTQSRNATKSFQRSLKMSQDGLIGQHTWAYLIEHIK